MKKQLLVATLAAVMMGSVTPAAAENIGAGFDVSTNVSLVSDYLWRGISQSNTQPAVQGGIDVKHAWGPYVGLWMSSLSGWYRAGGSNYASSEQDHYLGYNIKVTEKISVDVRYTQFMYGGNHEANFDEFHTAVSAFGATVGTDYADNRSNGNDSTIHYYGSYAYTLPFKINVSTTLGEYDLKDPGIVLLSDNEKYAYWNVGVSRAFGGVTWGLSYNNTDLSAMECAALTADITSSVTSLHNAKNACGEQFVLSATTAL